LGVGGGVLSEGTYLIVSYEGERSTQEKDMKLGKLASRIKPRAQKVADLGIRGKVGKFGKKEWKRGTKKYFIKEKRV